MNPLKFLHAYQAKQMIQLLLYSRQSAGSITQYKVLIVDLMMSLLFQELV